MNWKKYDKIGYGIIVGIIGAMLGFLLFSAGFCLITGTSMSSFMNDWFVGIQDWQPRIVTFSVLVDVVLFYLCVRSDMYNFGKGLMVILVLAVLAVSWLEFAG